MAAGLLKVCTNTRTTHHHTVHLIKMHPKADMAPIIPKIIIAVLPAVVDVTQETLLRVNESSVMLSQQYSQLSVQLELVKTDLQELQTNCSSTALSSLCSSSLPDPSVLSTPANFSNVSAHSTTSRVNFSPVSTFNPLPSFQTSLASW